MSGVMLTEGPHGFAWGPVEVRRTAEMDGRVVLTITTDANQAIDVYVSATGRSLRVFAANGKGELKPEGAWACNA